MSDARNESLREKMNALRQIYASELPSRVAEIERDFSHLQENTTDNDALRTLQRLAHNLVGSGATFGFPTISQKAGDLNALLKPLVGGSLEPAASTLRQISAAIRDLKEASLKCLPLSAPSRKDQPPILTSLAPHPEGGLIVLVESDSDLAGDLSLRMSYFGYSVEILKRISQLETILETKRPAAIIVDVDSTDGAAIGPSDVSEIKRRLGPKGPAVPVVLISSQNDLQAHLAAVRAGGNAYFAKPIDAASLADKLDTLTRLPNIEPCRILIVEDEVLEAKRYAAILQGAGMITAEVTDPMKVMQALVEFRPDLILMDIFMPHCSGTELAAVIRQQEAYVGIPIVFCSVERDSSKQFEALLLGGDDFLTKPVSPERLISLVTSRTRRSRSLRSHIVHDGLTGLLNHTNLKMQLNLEVARAKRLKSGLSYAMIDIDRLKPINDTYGHVAGDRVIRTVARLLKQRLRKTDIVGRYGGDEFAAILLEADTPAASKILEEIRDSFSRIQYRAGEAEFSATLSCGIASYPECPDAEALVALADNALLQAKARGGNHLVPA